MSVSSVAQQLDSGRLSKKLYYQIGVGIASTNFNYPEAGYFNKPLLFVHADVFLVKNITPRFGLRVGIAFEPVGYTYTTSLGNGQSSLNKARLYYSNLHLMSGYRLIKQTKRIDTRLLTGIFLGKLLEQDIVNLLKPDNKTFKSRAVSTYRSWNGGVSVGLSSSMTVRKYNAVGMKLIIAPGLERVGELKKADSRVTFVVAKLQRDDQTVYQTDRLPVGRNIALSTPQTQT